MHAACWLQAERFGLMRMVRMRDGSKPGCTAESVYKLRIRSPALTTSTTVSATSAPMSQVRNRVHTVPVDRWLPVRMAVARSICDALQIHLLVVKNASS
jgi:hypothetical protein